MSKKFPEYKKFDLSEINREVNAFWKENRIFEKSVETREGKTTFVFNEGSSFGQWNTGYPSCDGPYH